MRPRRRHARPAPRQGRPDRRRHGLDRAVPAPGRLRHRLRHRRVPGQAQAGRARAAGRPVPRPRPRARPPTTRPGTWSTPADIPGGHTEGLGTVGRGNHFVELARVGTVLDAGHAARLGLAAGDLVLIVHSGSRGLGERILRAHTEVHGAGPAADPAAYLAAHDDAVRWGSLNRRLHRRPGRARARRASRPSRSSTSATTWSRSATAATCTARARRPGDGRDVLIAGTRGTPSYLVAAHAGAEANCSVAHGAGRKMSRADALRRGKAKHTVEELRRTPVGLGGGLRRPAAAVRGGADRVQADRAGDRRPRRPRPGHPGGRDRAAGHLQDRRRRRRQPRTPVDDRHLLHVGRSRPAGMRLGGGPADRPPGGRRGPARPGGPADRDRAGRAPRHLPVGAGRARPAPAPTTFAAAWTGTLCWQAPSPYRPAPAGRTGTSSPSRARSTPRHALRRGRRRDRRLPHRRPRRAAPQQGQHGGPGDPPPDRHRRGGRHRAPLRARTAGWPWTGCGNAWPGRTMPRTGPATPPGGGSTTNSSAATRSGSSALDR